jgi:26S proteasome regulatory subunit N1
VKTPLINDFLKNEEDEALKEKLELCVERLADKDVGLRKNALQMIKDEVAGATASMTSVPKPLKFMTPLYGKLKEAFEAYTAQDDFKVSFNFNQFIFLQKKFADLCSVIAMVAEEEEGKEMLDFCLKGSMTTEDIKTWGHEYLRTLSGHIGSQYNKRVENGDNVDDLLKLVDIIVPQFINHNEEPEAVDLMMETESLNKLSKFCNARNFDRVCRYLCTCS